VICRCTLQPNVRFLNGWHIERLTRRRAQDLYFDKALAAEKALGAVSDEKISELWSEAGDLSARYVGTDVAVEKCPSYAAREADRQAAEKARKARLGKMRGPRSED
jgi:hypothetical protein